MANQKADTSLTDLLKIVTLLDDPKQFNALITVLHKSIPIRRIKRRIPMADANINKTFTIKRINHSLLAKIVSRDSDNMYNAKIISVVEGTTFNKAGDEFPISKRELELTGRPTSSKS
jgi:hypothetical protein